MLTLRLQRKWYTVDSTCGELSLESGEGWFTLELPLGDGSPGFAIPSGTYPVEVRHSPRFGRDMPHVDGVTGRQGILIHWGNYPRDTDGCVLVGKTHSADFVGESRVAFDELFALLARVSTLIVLDAPGIGAPAIDPELGM